MFRFLQQSILISAAFTLSAFGYGQTKDTVDWSALLQHSNFTEINSTKKIDKNILAKFPSWKRISNRGGQFNATDVGSGRGLRLFFIAKRDNHWIISYEHGGRGYHTHCFLITIDSDNNLDIQESDMKFESLDYLKAFTKTDNNLFRQWRGYEH
jgi:hypothetical protein